MHHRRGFTTPQVGRVVVADSSATKLRLVPEEQEASHEDVRFLHLPNLQELRYAIREDYGDVYTLFCLLAACPSISILEIGALSSSASHGPALTTRMVDIDMVLRHLTHLIIYPMNHTDQNLVLSRLSCPFLHTFVVLNDEIVKPHHLRRFTDFFSRSARSSSFSAGSSCHRTADRHHPLRELRLVYKAFDIPYSICPHYVDLMEALKELLSLLVELEDLLLGEFVMTNVLLKQMTLGPGGEHAGALCPSLVVMQLHLTFAGGILWKEVLEEMIVLRWRAEKRSLRAVTTGHPWIREIRG